ncbi:hypothetical protein [Streptomyces sp. GC420]|uniref:hypothetical protein n=1 Tax=Streptomyces sp. GC420 TaxID=2697568 RepID=UPI0014152993|nr:hypothetical protein [Streptomyces sp. GC420]NBM18975.1 hypothetical protein [Streptomyces sp. GC420]
MGNALLGLVGRTADVDRLDMPEIAGIGAARVLLVTVPTAPAPRRTTRPEGLRTD